MCTARPWAVACDVGRCTAGEESCESLTRGAGLRAVCLVVSHDASERGLSQLIRPVGNKTHYTHSNNRLTDIDRQNQHLADKV